MTAPVRVDGSLREMFHEGKTGTVVAFDGLFPREDLYGLGALADLDGEITIVDGTAFLSYPDGESVRTETTTRPTGGAALLVTTRVSEWRSVTTEDAVPFEALDEFIATLVTAEGPTPFLVEGPVEQLRWHVIDGARLSGGGGSHHDHLAASIRGASDRADVTLVGFYATDAMGVFTHRGSRTHLHFVARDPAATGHVDHVVLPAGTTIRLPR